MISHAQHSNPFFNRQRITDAAYFHGRARELEALYSAIITRQSRSLVGERKLGKSSLLTHLACPEALRGYNLDPARHVFLYIDLEGMANTTYAELWPEWLDLLAAAIPASQPELQSAAQALALQTDVRFLQVRRLLRRLERAGLTLVIMLDEFESLATNPHFDAGFYGELRSLAGELGVVYLTASKRNLFDLTYQHADTLSSPFFNIFSELTLDLLPDAEALDLLRNLSAMTGGDPFDAEDSTALLDLAGPHPFFLQVAGYYLAEAQAGGVRGEAALAQVERRLKIEAEDHFRYWWRGLETADRHALRQLPRTAPDPEVLRRLRERALVREWGDGRWHPFSRAFADFVQRTDQRDLQSLLPGSTNETSRLSGETLGSYRVLTPIGRGGMAVVYKGYQPALDRYVAIKVLATAVADDDNFAERFQREAAAVGRLRHQNLVQMLDFGLQGELTYMVMEYIDGDTLKERLAVLRAEGQRMPLPEVAHIIRDVAAALDYAHAYGIVHRDVKPANVMLRPEQRLAEFTGEDAFTAVLTDFGIARILEDGQLTGTGATVGTPDYMSPEQSQGDPATTASDVYALGIMLFELVTNELPFQADAPLAVLLKHLQARPPLLSSLVPDVPLGLETVVARALAKDPSQRYPKAGQLARAVAEALETAV